MELNDLTDEQIFSLRMFVFRADRLENFAKPLQKTGFSYKFTASKRRATSRVSGLPTELREAAIVNELRSFWLTNSPNKFGKVRNIVSSIYKDDQEKQKVLKNFKKSWEGTLNSEPQQVQIRKNKTQNFTYNDAYKIIVDGVYAHNDRDEYEIYETVKGRLFVLPHFRKMFKDIILRSISITQAFKTDFVLDILKEVDLRGRE